MSNLREAIHSVNALVQFEAAARHLSFSLAAADLGVTQSAISHSIKQLEASLGIALFIRKPRALELTPAGEKLAANLTLCFSSMAETINSITGRSEEPDEIVLACSTAMAHYWLMPRILGFRRAFPTVHFRMNIVERDIDLVQDQVDIYLRLGDGRWPDYDNVQLWPEEIYAVASSNYLRKSPDIKSCDDFRNHQLIVYEDPLRNRCRWPEWLLAQGVTNTNVHALIRVTDSAVALQSAADDVGVTLGWRPTIDDLIATHRLCIAFNKPVSTGRHFYLQTRKGRAFQKPLSLFCDWLTEQYRHSKEHFDIHPSA